MFIQQPDRRGEVFVISMASEAPMVMHPKSLERNAFSGGRDFHIPVWPEGPKQDSPGQRPGKSAVP